MRWAEHIEHMGKMRNMCNILVGKLGGKKPLGRPRYRWKDSIRLDLREWIHMAQDGDKWWDLVNTVMNLRVI
jgi:hypothetical protein